MSRPPAGNRYSVMMYMLAIATLLWTLPSPSAAMGRTASDTMVAAKLLSVTDTSGFNSAQADPGSHYVVAKVQLKNLSDVALPFYRIQPTLMRGATRVAAGQFYDDNRNELGSGNATPGETVTYIAVFTIGDGVKSDSILLHPPFIPSTSHPDLLLKK